MPAKIMENRKYILKLIWVSLITIGMTFIESFLSTPLDKILGSLLGTLIWFLYYFILINKEIHFSRVLYLNIMLCVTLLLLLFDNDIVTRVFINYFIFSSITFNLILFVMKDEFIIFSDIQKDSKIDN